MKLDREFRLQFSESLEPDNLLAMGKESLETRNYPEAVNRFQKLLLVDPKNKEGRTLLTQAESLLDKEKQSRLQEEVLRKRTQQRNFLEREAKIRFSQQDWSDAVELWQKWVRFGGDPKQGEGEIQRCWDRLYADAEKALAAKNPERAIALFQSIGVGYRDAGERAKRLRQELQKERIAAGKEKYQQGMEAYVAGEFNKARDLFQEALILNPADDRALQALSRMKEELTPVTGKEPRAP